MIREGATRCFIGGECVQVPVETRREREAAPGDIRPAMEGLLLEVTGEVRNTVGGHGDTGHLRGRAVVPASSGQADLRVSLRVSRAQTHAAGPLEGVAGSHQKKKGGALPVPAGAIGQPVGVPFNAVGEEKGKKTFELHKNNTDSSGSCSGGGRRGGEGGGGLGRGVPACAWLKGRQT